MVYCVLCGVCVFFFFKQKTAYEMRISDWSSDVCSSDLGGLVAASFPDRHQVMARTSYVVALGSNRRGRHGSPRAEIAAALTAIGGVTAVSPIMTTPPLGPSIRSEEHTSELQSLMRISYAVFCLKNKIKPILDK